MRVKSNLESAQPDFGCEGAVLYSPSTYTSAIESKVLVLFAPHFGVKSAYLQDRFACGSQVVINMSDLQQTNDPPAPNNNKRISIGLSGDIVELLEFLAERQGISQNEAIRRAIATDYYFLKERLQGANILIQKPDRDIREVVFR